LKPSDESIDVIFCSSDLRVTIAIRKREPDCWFWILLSRTRLKESECCIVTSVVVFPDMVMRLFPFFGDLLLDDTLHAAADVDLTDSTHLPAKTP